jgi:uncharacterized membrane protein YdjX (TVP38/TMEM64 family)
MGSSAQPEPHHSAIKVLLLALLVAGLLLLFRLTESYQLLTEEHLQRTVKQFGIWASIAYVALYALSRVLALPGAIMSISGGFLFGKWFGTLWAVLGATLGDCCIFAVSRTLGRDFVARRLVGKRWFQVLDRGVAEAGFSFMLFLRVVPIVPPSGLSFGSGLTSIRFRDYVLGTLIGLLPGTFVMSSVAADARSMAVAEHFRPSLSLLLGLGTMGVLALLPSLYRWWRGSRETKGVRRLEGAHFFQSLSLSQDLLDRQA